MAVTRGVVKPIKHGEVRSKGGAMSLLSGLGLDHVNYCQPNFFKTLSCFCCWIMSLIMQLQGTPVVKTEQTSVKSIN